MRISPPWALVPLFLLLATTGCGRGPLSPVHGKITYNGYPVPGGVVCFVPDYQKGESGPVAIGKIREDGSYTLYTGDSPGAAPGYFRITVCSLAPTSYSSTHGQFQFPTGLLPEQFRNPDSTSLFQKIESNRVHNFDISLP